MDWFLYENGLHHEKVRRKVKVLFFRIFFPLLIKRSFLRGGLSNK